MRGAGLLILSLTLVFSAGAQSLDSPTPVDEASARKNLLSDSEPVYPPIAKAARVQGTVEISVVVDPSGKVHSATVLSGPAMLRQASLDAVHQWTFKPFKLNGAPVAVSALFTFPFQIDKPGEGPTKEQAEAAQAWFPVSDQCRNALTRSDAAESINWCRQALDLALKAGDTNSSDQIGMMLSHQYYGHALIIAGKPQDALAEENTAVDENRRWRKDTDQEYAMPFFWRAMAEARLGQPDAAFADLQIAEQTHRRAIIHLPEMRKNYSQTLASILRTHASLLDQVGRTAEAAKLRAEADTL